MLGNLLQLSRSCLSNDISEVFHFFNLPLPNHPGMLWSSFILTFVVFLGGACNPTTWRKDVVIPILESLGLSYYNPVGIILSFPHFNYYFSACCFLILMNGSGS
ncbi:unnamed protein product [Trichobilharzia regenti]|nr:unnamed protein product [Trichobilharzia regenti]